MLAEPKSIAALLPPLLSKVEVPPTVDTPLSVIAPLAIIAKFWPTPTVPKSIAFESVTPTLFVPLLLKLTAPVKSLAACVSVIAFPPAVKLEAPATVRAPDWVIAPPATMVRSLMLNPD